MFSYIIKLRIKQTANETIKLFSRLSSHGQFCKNVCETFQPYLWRLKHLEVFTELATAQEPTETILLNEEIYLELSITEACKRLLKIKGRTISSTESC